MNRLSNSQKTRCATVLLELPVDDISAVEDLTIETPHNADARRMAPVRKTVLVHSEKEADSGSVIS